MWFQHQTVWYPHFSYLVAVMTHSTSILAHLMSLLDPYLLNLYTCNSCLTLLPIHPVKNMQLQLFGTFYITISILPHFVPSDLLIPSSAQSVQSLTPSTLASDGPNTFGISHETTSAASSSPQHPPHPQLPHIHPTMLSPSPRIMLIIVEVRVHACTDLV